MRSIVFNVDPTMKITPQVIKKISNEDSYSSNPPSFSIFSLIFAMFAVHQSFSAKCQFPFIPSWNNCTCYFISYYQLVQVLNNLLPTIIFILRSANEQVKGVANCVSSIRLETNVYPKIDNTLENL